MANILLRTKLNEPSAEQLALPFYNMLPKDRVGLLLWRIYVRERALHDLEFRRAFLQMCAADVAFFACSCVWFHETRVLEGQTLGKFPVHLDCDQIDILAWLAKYLGAIDITISKTRGIGLSYLVCVVLMWLWLFHGQQIETAVVTKDESSLDLKDRPSSLMGKLDLMFSELPAWMRCDSDGNNILNRTVTKHKFFNEVSYNVIGGFVAVDEKLRSGRYFCVILDEAAFFPSDIQRWLSAASGTSPSICWLSTFNGTANLFHRIATNADKHVNVVRIETFWQASPRWSAGKYVSRNGVIEIIDKSYVFPPDYEFSHDDPGLERSPMVDLAFRRPGASKQSVKEEIYGIAVQDSRKLFNKSVVNKMEKTVRRPTWRGDYINGEWVEDEEGPVQLWQLPHSLNGVYCVGADPSLGTIAGAAAGLAAIDVKTGMVALSARFQDLDGVAFAQKAVAICKALAGPRGSGYARLAYESTGIGVAFSSEVARLRYSAVWSEPGKSTPGCHNTDRGEAWLLELGRAIAEENAILVSRDCLSELKNFEYDLKFDLQYAGVEGHGDLAIATALAWRAAQAKRRAVIEAGKANANRFKSELTEYNSDQRRKPWSAKFDEPRRPRGTRWL